jgi:aspartyl-tRNA(Asn)/glutamyl-tRNA(Gln) amidotransferase subunit B
MTWETVIGLEVHIQLNTTSKLFSGSSTAYGALPNTQACAIDLGLPGVLPVLNQEAVTMAVKLGLSINAAINHRSIFARKNYFYPDLPKGYQISQFELPIVHGGYLDILGEDGQEKRIRITRAHLEEDAGKSLHDVLPGGMSGIDLNRAGTALLEIVSEPDMRSAKEAVAYLKVLHSLVRYLGICDGNMQEGSFRCDANVSVRRKGEAKLGTRTELKNINSFKFVEKAIYYEVERQINILEENGTIIQETRLYDETKNETRTMRSKEEAQDYRYFPDPDLLPVVLTPDFVKSIQENLPELSPQKRARFEENYKLSKYEANLLSYTQEWADYFEKLAALSSPKLSANWMLGEFAAALNKNNLDITHSPLSPEKFAGLLNRIADQTLSNNIAKKVFEQMWETGQTADDIIQSQGLQQVTDSKAITAIITEVMENNPEQLAQYRAGKDKLFGFFVGQVMKSMGGKANPEQVNALLKKLLNS